MRTLAIIVQEREEKCRRVLSAVAEGWPGTRLVTTTPDYENSRDEFECIFWGQIWRTAVELPRAIASGRRFWHIDNGYWLPSRGQPTGYHRMTRNGMSPAFWSDAPAPRSPALAPKFLPWRRTGGHVLIALPGEEFGRAIGLRMTEWIHGILERVRSLTDRKVVIRPRLSSVPLAEQLRDCWAVVTHSSNVGTDAVMAGIPVFCEATCPAAPVGNLDLEMLERPQIHDRRTWWNSLVAQQFTNDEFRSGLAREYLLEACRGMG